MFPGLTPHLLWIEKYVVLEEFSISNGNRKIYSAQIIFLFICEAHDSQKVRG